MDNRLSSAQGVRTLREMNMSDLFKKPASLLLPLCFLTICIGIVAVLALRDNTSNDMETKIAKAKKTALSKVLKNNDGKNIVSNDSVREHLLWRQAQYEIVYQEAFDLFLISVNEAPFEETRKKAEQAFLALLEASDSVACRMNVRVVSPYFANPDVAGQQFPLSFCEP